MPGELKRARMLRQYTQMHMATEVGIGLGHYQAVEYERVEPSVVLALKIAEVLSIDDYNDFKLLFPPCKQRYQMKNAVP